MEEKQIFIDVDGVSKPTSYVINENGDVFSTHKLVYQSGITKHKLKPQLIGDITKYLSVRLCLDNKKYNYKIHRLVYQTFKGIIPDDMVINHKDNNKLNNHKDNLECVTSSYNRLDYLKRQKGFDMFNIEIYQYGEYKTTVQTCQQAAIFMNYKSSRCVYHLLDGAISKNGWTIKKIII